MASRPRLQTSPSTTNLLPPPPYSPPAPSAPARGPATSPSPQVRPRYISPQPSHTRPQQPIPQPIRNAPTQPSNIIAQFQRVSSTASISTTGSGSGRNNASHSIADKFAMSPDPASWGGNISPSVREADDYLHNPDPKRDRASDKGGSLFTVRGLSNLGCLFILFAGLLMLFAGYPLLSYFLKHPQLTFGGFNFGATNGTGQVASMGNFGLIDLDTPKEAYTKADYVNGKTWELVFSDEFNVDGRTFYPGDDPYWEAVDLHYWGTNDLEWYDPAAITTANGSLEITFSSKETHDLAYQGGMMSSWNKFCFTGGLLEVAVVLPGSPTVSGFWPAVWTMGNLGRAGYGASLEGTWPYTYDSCDIGTVANQSIGGLPVAAVTNGDPQNGDTLSYLQGQRLSRCTCPGESHPGPVHEDGTYVGRSAPEIDVFESTVKGDAAGGALSQSCQWAPFNAEYKWQNTSDNLIIPDPTITTFNSYQGGAFQQVTSSLTDTELDGYELTNNQFKVYGVQYQPGFDDAYIAWIGNDKRVWQMEVAGMVGDPQTEISARPVPQEPMYIIMNLGMSKGFQWPDFDNLQFPATMKIDYVRVYQDPDRKNVGCDPTDFPTAAYINQYMEAYINPNLTTWRQDFGQPFPKNSFLNQC